MIIDILLALVAGALGGTVASVLILRSRKKDLPTPRGVLVLDPGEDDPYQ